MPIYTKKGDKGETGLPGGRRLPKSEPVFDVLGNLDMVNSAIGLAIALLPKKMKDIIADLQHIQQILLSIGATIAAESANQLALATNLKKETNLLEDQIDTWDKALPELKNFILPGGSQAGAALHLTRSIIRQAERSYQKTPNTKNFPEIDAYLNRLSDYFFQVARFVNFQLDSTEPTWKN